MVISSGRIRACRCRRFQPCRLVLLWHTLLLCTLSCYVLLHRTLFHYASMFL